MFAPPLIDCESKQKIMLISVLICFFLLDNFECQNSWLNERSMPDETIPRLLTLLRLPSRKFLFHIYALVFVSFPFFPPLQLTPPRPRRKKKRLVNDLSACKINWFFCSFSFFSVQIVPEWKWMFIQVTGESEALIMLRMDAIKTII